MTNAIRNAFATAATVALGFSALGADAANVLVVLSDASQLELRDNRTFDTGFYANELMQPVKKLLDAGHTITFATPLGKAPSLDRHSVDKMYFDNDEASMQQHLALLEKLRITSAEQSPVVSLARVEQGGYARYDALYVPGGHAPMQDLPHSAALGRLLRDFHARAKPTALVCHGPIALLSALERPEQFTRKLISPAASVGAAPAWIYAGYQMTVISNSEEAAAKGMLNGGTMKFLPQTALQRAGGVYSSAANWQSKVVVDRELITGQNPASASAVADQLLARLKR